MVQTVAPDTDTERTAQELPLSPALHRLLEGARHVTFGWMNAAPGTHCWRLRQLEAMGLMREVWEPSTTDPYRSVYIVTSEGRAVYLSYANTAVPISDWPPT